MRSSQHNKGSITPNQIGGKRLAPGNTDIVHAGQFRPGKGVLPKISMAAKYDHGHGPEDHTHMNKKFAKTGTTQHPKQTTIGFNGVGLGVEGRR